MTTRQPSVAIAVLTYQRPGDLAQVLPALLVQARTIEPTATVIVVDNDPAASAERIVRACAAEGVEVRYVHEPEPGIAAARNRALAECGQDVLVFIDDDERPTTRWLRLLVETYLRDRPAGVVGPVVSEPAREPDPWIVAGDFFERERRTTGSEVTTAATNNLLLDLAQVREHGLSFDTRFGLSGGSDTLFTRQLVRSGGRLVWCDEAVVTDVVPATRLTRAWVLRRAYRSGNSDSRTTVELAVGRRARILARLWMTGRGILRLAGGSLRWLLGLLTGSLRRRVRGRRTIMRGAGMLAGAWGSVYHEYARTT